VQRPNKKGQGCLLQITLAICDVRDNATQYNSRWIVVPFNHLEKSIFCNKKCTPQKGVHFVFAKVE